MPQYNKTSHILFAAVMALALLAGFLGIDFGNHWDEGPIFRGVRRSIESGRWLPDWYNYPSTTHDLVVLATLTKLPDARRQATADKGTRTALSELSQRRSVKFRARAIFIVLTLLSTLWTYLAVLRWRRPVGEALLAAALLAGSWEVGYHARWIAPDGVMMQFVALFLLCVTVALRSGSAWRRWTLAAAVAAGLACGTKYTGGIWLVALIFYALQLARAEKARAWPVALSTVAVFAVTVVLTTPGILFDTRKFISDVYFEYRHYGSQHAGYTVARGLEHAWLMAQYVVLSGPSRFWPLSAFVAVLAVVGAVQIIRHDYRLVMALLVVPALYCIILSLQRVMLVRNLLMVFPPLMILAARGAAVVVEQCRARSLRYAFIAACTLTVCWNVTWLLYAADSIRGRDNIDERGAVADFLDKHRGDTVFMSARVRALAQGLVIPPDVHLTDRRGEATRFLIAMCDGFDRKNWPANRHGRWRQLTGPYDLNLDYYPTWGGDCRVIDVDPQTAVLLGAVRGQR